MKNDCAEFPLRIFETMALIFPRLPFPFTGDLQPSSSLQSYPVIEAKLCSLRSELVGVQGLGYRSQLMEK